MRIKLCPATWCLLAQPTQGSLCSTVAAVAVLQGGVDTGTMLPGHGEAMPVLFLEVSDEHGAEASCLTQIKALECPGV